MLSVCRKPITLLFLLLGTFVSTALSGQQLVSQPLLPNGVAYDAAGNLYFADTNRHQVYESSLAGVLTVIAGSGVQGSSGDGGAATAAELNSPEGVAVGADGTIYIADTGNNRIRAVIGGQITAFGGNGKSGFGGDGGPALAAMFNRPNALALDNAGGLLVCDSLNHRVRRLISGNITTIAGSGVQGAAGDAALATAALLDTPSGVAATADGLVYVADSHNNRIRLIQGGNIRTVAGTGLAGYSGDGGPATSAMLAFPRGLYATPSGALLVSDSNNQRLRMIDGTGTISTLAGSGVQGTSQDASTSLAAGLDTPRGVAVSTFGSPVISDAGNKTVRESLPGGKLYLPAGLATGRTTSVLLTDSPGAEEQSVFVSVVGTAGIPRGAVELLEETSIVAHGTLVAGSTTLGLSGLGAGPHVLTAMFVGDGVNPAGTSKSLAVNVSELVVVATADNIVVGYGAVVPALKGSFTGVLPDDAGEVDVVFSSAASELAAPGTYPITASLTGSASGKYEVVLSAASGSLEIDRAPTLTAEQALAQSSYAGLPLVLTAGVVSTTQGTPSGLVTFSDGATVIGTGTLTGGVASATFLEPSAGKHSITSTYGGDVDFAGSASLVVTTVVGAMPDFTLVTAGNATQTVAAGGSASYGITVGASPGPFTGVVSLSMSGAPAGWTASFSPEQAIPGAGNAVVTMILQTTEVSSRSGFEGFPRALAAWLLLPLGLLVARRRRLKAALLVGTLFMLLGSVTGCSTRSVTTAVVTKRAYSLLVTGTATNLAGNVVTHSTTVTLIVQ